MYHIITLFYFRTVRS